MKVLHTIEGMGGKFGGIATCTFDLINALSRSEVTKVEVTLLSPALKDATDVRLDAARIWAVNLPNDGIGPFNYSRNVGAWLATHSFDIYHANGMWQYIVHATCRKARREGKPYLITPHGMLYRHALKIKPWKKWSMRKLWFDRDILHADCVHVACKIEMEELRAFGYKSPIAVIGNPVSVPSFVEGLFKQKEQQSALNPTRKSLVTIGLLARFHPIKGIENLIRAVAMSDNCKLILMGAGDEAYTRSLRLLIDEMGINSRVEFAGFVSGEEKFRRLAELDALFVPSDMENFGMIVPEALLVGTPVYASKGTPWQELEEKGCGWWRDNSPQELVKVIDEVASKSPKELFEMGCRGRELVLEKYEASKVAAKMFELYRWLLGEGKKPAFVYID